MDRGEGMYIYIPITIMIELTRLNGEQFFINLFLIEQIQTFIDTTITLTSGKKVIVSTTQEEISEKILHYHKQIGLLGIENRRVME